MAVIGTRAFSNGDASQKQSGVNCGKRMDWQRVAAEI
jgi:hypothetical protein